MSVAMGKSIDGGLVYLVQPAFEPLTPLLKEAKLPLDLGVDTVDGHQVRILQVPNGTPLEELASTLSASDVLSFLQVAAQNLGALYSAGLLPPPGLINLQTVIRQPDGRWCFDVCAAYLNLNCQEGAVPANAVADMNQIAAVLLRGHSDSISEFLRSSIETNQFRSIKEWEQVLENCRYTLTEAHDRKRLAWTMSKGLKISLGAAVLLVVVLGLLVVLRR